MRSLHAAALFAAGRTSEQDCSSGTSMMIKAGIIENCLGVPIIRYADVFHIQTGMDETR